MCGTVSVDAILCAARTVTPPSVTLPIERVPSSPMLPPRFAISVAISTLSWQLICPGGQSSRLTLNKTGAAEVEEYNFSDPHFNEKTGHFTQLVWKGTTTVGCGSRLCGSRGWYLVCEYWPRGNVVGEFGDQVNLQINGSHWTNDTAILQYVVWFCGFFVRAVANSAA